MKKTILYGLPGSGKTNTARQIAESYQAPQFISASQLTFDSEDEDDIVLLSDLIPPKTDLVIVDECFDFDFDDFFYTYSLGFHAFVKGREINPIDDWVKPDFICITQEKPDLNN